MRKRTISMGWRVVLALLKSGVRGALPILVLETAPAGPDDRLAAQVVQPQGLTWAPAPAWEVPFGVGEVCTPYQDPASATEWLIRAWGALAIPDGQVLHIHFLDRALQLVQSDRPYPPYLPSGSGGEIWIDPASGMIRESSTTIYPSAGRWGERSERLYDQQATWMARDTLMRLVPQLHPFTRVARTMDPISVLSDWRAGATVRVSGVCRYREGNRIVLERDGRWGTERLYLHPESALPIKLDATEPHYLWGQVRTEVVFATWWAAAGSDVVSPYPVGVSRLMDGGIVDDRAVGHRTWIPRAEAPFMAPNPPEEPMDLGDPGILGSPEPDTVRVADDTFLLVSPFYTEVVTLHSDTVWLLDATLGEERARQDHEWIRRLFGDDHPIAVVVTDLAWPHVAGVRYWVSQSATIISAATSEPFLRRIVEREWTLRPDALETNRDDAVFRFRPVRDSLMAAGGALQLFPIDGIGSETALLAWLPQSRFLWVGDYIQNVTTPTTYGLEVWRAVQRVAISPERFAAQHHPLTDWSVLKSILGDR